MVERLFRKHSACAVFSVRTTAVANTAFWQRFRCMVGLMRGSFHQLLEVNCVRTVGANKQAKRSKSTPSAPAWIQILVVVCFKNKNKQAKRSSTPSIRKVENAAPVQRFRANSSKTRGAVLAFWAHSFVATYLWYLVLTLS